MTVEELMELKRKADAIAEIEKTVVKETNTYKLTLDNIRQILKYIETTMRQVGIEYAEIPKFSFDNSAIFYLESNVFSVQIVGNYNDRLFINDSNFVSAVTHVCVYKDFKQREINTDFLNLAEKWTTYKQRFLGYIEESLNGSIKNSQKTIAERTERYVAAKEFQV